MSPRAGLNTGLYAAGLRASGNQEKVDEESRSLVHDFTTLEFSGGFGLPLDLYESFHRLNQILISGMQRHGQGDCNH